MAYNFTAEWLKQTKNDAPDALSRNPTSDPQPEDMLAKHDHNNDREMSIEALRILANDGHESIRLQDLRRHAESNPAYQQLQDIITNGFPSHRSQLPEECKRYWSAREHLTVEDGLILYGCRLLIPSSMRKETLTQLHESHQGQWAPKCEPDSRYTGWGSTMTLTMS